MNRTLKIGLLFLLSLLSTGCGHLLYLSRLGWHQSFVTFQSLPIEEVLSDETVADETKKKIHFIQEVKRYGEERLGLRRTGNYTKYLEIYRPVLYMITASQKDRFEFHSWSFPIIGRVTYKSFFTLADVLKEEERLRRKDYDTYVLQAAAYSTLGWLKDPIFSTMLRWDEATLANVILHEMVHATLFFKDATDLNEQLATFIGNKGAIHFLTEKYGSDSKEVTLAMAYQQDDLLFAKWIDEAYKRLSEFYQQPLTREEKLKGREEIFQSLRGAFREAKDRFQTDCYKGFDERKLNNAVLLAHRTYLQHLDRFEALYEKLGRDLRKVVEYFKEIKSSEDKTGLTSFKE